MDSLKSQTSTATPAEPGVFLKLDNPFSYMAFFRRSPGRLSVAMDSLYETPPGYVPPFTVDQNSVTIIRSGWDPADA